MAQLEAQAPTVRVNVAAIIDGLHHRYGQLLANLLQENAETAVGLEQLQTQLAEANSRIKVMEEMLVEAHEATDQTDAKAPGPVDQDNLDFRPEEMRS